MTSNWPRTKAPSVSSDSRASFDTTGSIGNYPIQAATAPGAADAIFIMGYDYRGSGSTYVGSIDPAFFKCANEFIHIAGHVAAQQ